MVLLFAVNANAATVKFNWLQSPNDVNGNPVQLTKFRVYWGADSNSLASYLEIGPPAPAPWRYEANGFGRYSKTVSRPEWVEGTTVCFAMQAFAGDAMSGLSNIICKVLTGNPLNPDLINIDQIP